MKELFEFRRLRRQPLRRGWSRRSVSLVVLLAVSGILSTPMLFGQAIARNRGTFRIASGVGPNGPMCVARFNHAQVVFEAPISMGDATDGNALGDDTTADERQPHQPGQIRFVVGTREDVIFGIGSDPERAAIACRLLDNLLCKELDSVSATCVLTSDQMKKLALAGRGDIKRFIDRAADVVSHLERPDNIPDEEQFRIWVTRLGAEYDRLGRLLNAGIFGAGSLFHKTLRTTLTPEQSAQLDAAEAEGNRASATPGGRASVPR
jgi:hypothetical protein